MTQEKPLLDLRDLSIIFQRRNGGLTAVSHVNLPVPASAITCLVGESGSGKSLTCKAVLRLTPEDALLEGEILYNNENLLAMPEKALRKIRGAAIGMIFQEPMTALNPVLTVGEQTAEPLRLHLGMSRKDAKKKVIELFEQVGIPEPATRYSDYPHQLSGGLRQRIMIAMALACGPDLLLADEPTTALDVTVQGQILRLIKAESRDRGMAVLLITHDLGVVAEMADYVGVIYAGCMMEYASAREIFTNPCNPYTSGLMAAQPSRDSIGLDRLPAIPGTVPTLENIPAGCPFEPRCTLKLPICAKKRPPVCRKGEHLIYCWLYQNVEHTKGL